jgi:hypothetical protein
MLRKSPRKRNPKIMDAGAHKRFVAKAKEVGTSDSLLCASTG